MKVYGLTADITPLILDLGTGGVNSQLHAPFAFFLREKAHGIH
jgi:hypothetical protein